MKLRHFMTVKTNFNSHAHVERDKLVRTWKTPLTNFNSHAHVERDLLNIVATLQLFYFNSHAHVERDMCGTNFGNGAKISTHTLTWSVTRCICMMNEFYAFQLTRSRGA